MVRLARKRRPATTNLLSERAGGEPRDVRLALRSLERASLVERLPDGAARLTFAGLAVAAASMPPAAPRVRVGRTRDAGRRAA
jgi:Mn-dependent DtxR family transcriptional regulator